MNLGRVSNQLPICAMVPVYPEVQSYEINQSLSKHKTVKII